MRLPYMADQCEQMLKISNEFVRLQVSHDEYLCMKVLLLLSTGEWRRRVSTLVTEGRPHFLLLLTLEAALFPDFSCSAKRRLKEPGGVWRHPHVLHQGAGESHREARTELQPELAAFLSAHQAAGFHAWGTEAEHAMQTKLFLRHQPSRQRLVVNPPEFAWCIDKIWHWVSCFPLCVRRWLVGFSASASTPLWISPWV